MGQEKKNVYVSKNSVEYKRLMNELTRNIKAIRETYNAINTLTKLKNKK